MIGEDNMPEIEHKMLGVSFFQPIIKTLLTFNNAFRSYVLTPQS